jgi:hypothetical protein
MNDRLDHSVGYGFEIGEDQGAKATRFNGVEALRIERAPLIRFWKSFMLLCER